MNVRVVGGPVDGVTKKVDGNSRAGQAYALNGDLYLLVLEGVMRLQFQNPTTYGLAELDAAILLDPVAPEPGPDPRSVS